MKFSTNNLPTYEDCVNLCNYSESPFYESKLVVEGYQVSMFNYRIAQNSDFQKKFAKELRGITFVFDGDNYTRFLLLEKFFNLNQTEDTQYHVLKNHKLKFVSEKEDGSIISFVKFPNGIVRARSKMSFDMAQAKMAQKIYEENLDIKRLVNWALDNNIIPVFEYVSPKNMIVLEYQNEDLILLRLRDNQSGKQLDLNDHTLEIGAVKVAPFYYGFNNLDEIIQDVEKKTNKEGFVIQTEDLFGNDFFFKIKTPWYVGLHRTLTEDVNRENVIIQYILEETIDDVISQVPAEKKSVHDRISHLITLVKRELDKKSAEIESDYLTFLQMGGDKKAFALKYLKTPNFSNVMSMANGKSSYDLAVVWLRDKTKRLLTARSFIKSVEPDFEFMTLHDYESV